MSVEPSAGPTYLLIGDAVGAANPLSGAGIEAALETGALAADVTPGPRAVDEAWYTVEFAPRVFTRAPAVLASMQSFAGVDVAGLRMRSFWKTGAGGSGC